MSVSLFDFPDINLPGGIFKSDNSLGFGDIVRPGSICSAHGHSCSCIPKNLAHSIYEDLEDTTQLPLTTSRT